MRKPCSPSLTGIAPSSTFQLASLVGCQPKRVSPSKRLIQPSAICSGVRKRQGRGGVRGGGVGGEQEVLRDQGQDEREGARRLSSSCDWGSRREAFEALRGGPSFLGPEPPDFASHSSRDRTRKRRGAAVRGGALVAGVLISGTIGACAWRRLRGDVHGGKASKDGAGRDANLKADGRGREAVESVFLGERELSVPSDAEGGTLQWSTDLGPISTQKFGPIFWGLTSDCSQTEPSSGDGAAPSLRVKARLIVTIV